MAELVTLDLQAIDFESAVDEVDVLIPKYLDGAEELESSETVEEVLQRLQAIQVYWDRLQVLFNQIGPMEADIPFDEIIRNTLQSELTALEQVYIKIHLRLMLPESEWSKDLWKAADGVLNRMDFVLRRIGFPEDHEDRLFVAKMRAENQGKQQRWLMRRHMQTKK